MRSSKLEPFVTAEEKPFLGRVSMDYVSIESNKEEVCIFNNAQKAGEQLGTISCEIITQLNSNIKCTVVSK